MLTFLEGADGKALQEAGVVFEVADVPPMDLVGMTVEMFVAESLQSGKHRVDLCLLREERDLGCGANGVAVHPFGVFNCVYFS